MLIVGSDRITLSGVTSAPDGTRHAVDADGRVLCRSSRPRFTWPALPWQPVDAEGDACSLCAQVHMAHEALVAVDPYPSGSLALAPWQPSPGLFVPNEQ